MTTNFEVGQSVTVLSGYGSYLTAVSIIERMTKRKIILKNGMEFTDRGKQWGAAGSYGAKAIRATRPGDREKIRRTNLIDRLSQVRWDTLSDEQLIETHKIVRPDDPR